MHGSPGTLGKVSGGPERVHGVSWDGLESSWIDSGVSLGIPGGLIRGLVRVLCARVYVCVCVCGFSVIDASKATVISVFKKLAFPFHLSVS